MGLISISTASDGTTADVADINTPLTTIVNEINGNLDNSNIKAGAAIDGSKLADGTVTDAKRGGGFYIGTIAAATLNSTGDKAITGVGFTPKLVEFTVRESSNAANSSHSTGAMTTSAQYATSTAGNVSGGTTNLARNSATDGCLLRVNSGNTTTLKASYVSMDADGFTINVSTAGSHDVSFKAYA